ncbi:uncharacterized protein BCR38DRAFT_76295 [Pseudomassariella vexata]|uniref:Uncharacterized protein n=1 Tax=Pseudomassariella vexata TaxID=1141098 RepID=A0A1Y2DG84_9PEZI|nr:uncharacterized protein BCR38DRAFT_76295 [Pseudomassariella vexata]ORY58094.1 hypothetical protein BCR38DRAFT_76295 [Pseudomassariella vexata]
MAPRNPPMLAAATSTSPRNTAAVFTCETPACGGFSDQRSLLRHLETSSRHVPKDSPAFANRSYRCRCGKSALRKDNRFRHLRSCVCTEGEGTYRCKCGREDDDELEHTTHSRMCGVKRRGRGLIRQC